MEVLSEEDTHVILGGLRNTLHLEAHSTSIGYLVEPTILEGGARQYIYNAVSITIR